MLIKLNRNVWQQGQQRVWGTLFIHQRWWEAGVISVGLVASVGALYWWLWWPVASNNITITSLNEQLDVAAIEQLTGWMTTRERRGADGNSYGSD